MKSCSTCGDYLLRSLLLPFNLRQINIYSIINYELIDMYLERENKEKEKFLFITGAPKTATSTLVGILNCHPNIFILYETYLNQGWLSKYGKRFLAKYPNARYLFKYQSKIDLNCVSF